MAAVNAFAEGAALADEMLLADELLEGPRPHPRRKWLGVGRRLEQALLLLQGRGPTTRCARHVADGTRRISRTRRVAARFRPVARCAMVGEPTPRSRRLPCSAGLEESAANRLCVCQV